MSSRFSPSARRSRSSAPAKTVQVELMRTDLVACMAMEATKSVRINSTCTVFAGAELRDRLALGERREDILAGLHRAIILRAMSIISRSGGVTDQFTFTGGVANNEAAVRELRKLVQENYGDITININPASIYTGALGAAAFARRAVENGAGETAS